VARDVSFFQRPIVSTLGQLRIIPDTVIIVIGVLPLLVFLFKTFPHLKKQEIKEGESVWDRLGVKL
jgi:nitric oxide reductase subunit B